MSRQPGAGYRHTRLEQLIHEELAALVRDELSDPDLYAVVVTGVRLSPDYKNARVAFAIAGEPRPPAPELGRRERALARASRLLRARVGEAIDAKFVPELRFFFDRDAVVEMSDLPPKDSEDD